MFALESSGRNGSIYSINSNFIINENANTVDINIPILLCVDANINIGFNLYLNGSIYDSLSADNYKKGTVINYIITATFNRGDLDKDLIPKMEIITDGANTTDNIHYDAAGTQTVEDSLIVKAKDLNINEPYKDNLDRITEHELVPDFVYRLNMNNDLPSNNYSIINSISNKKVIDLLDRLYAGCPALIFQNNNIKKITIPVPKNTNCILVVLNSDNALKYTIYSAYSDKARLDYSGAFNSYSTSTTFNAGIEFDTPYPCDDNISLLLTKN